MTRTSKLYSEVWERAVRMVLEHGEEYESQLSWAPVHAAEVVGDSGDPATASSLHQGGWRS
jgi:hypothetical protein